MKRETKESIVSIIVTAALVAVLVLCLPGCSHNAVTYSDGIGFETTLRPDNGNFGITFRYGKILSAVLRENSEVEMTGDGKGSGGSGETSPGSASSSGSVKIKIGRQLTGYYVDAMEAGAKPEQIEEYLKEEKKAE